jgi:5S rRNA maturation endonuclease (ribonuclease M5)
LSGLGSRYPYMESSEGWDEFLDVLLRLRERVRQEGAVLLVEGDRDRTSLQCLGIPTDSVILAHNGRRLAQVAQDLQDRSRPVVILTDWDRKGGQLAHRLSQMLAGQGIPVDLELRRRLSRVVLGEVQTVEGLISWASRTAERTRRPLDLWLSDLDRAEEE